jgi:hypothetical protein
MARKNINTTIDEDLYTEIKILAIKLKVNYQAPTLLFVNFINTSSRLDGRILTLPWICEA